jgi:hypothetical protein
LARRLPAAPPRPPTREETRQVARKGRRLVLAGFGGIAAALGGLAVGIPLLFPDAQPPPRFSNRRIIPPLLRARLELRQPYGREADRRGTPPGDLAAEEALFALVRADMRFLGAPQDGPPPFEMLQLWAYLADDAWPSEWKQVAVVEPGGAPDARLIAAQGGTVWAWVGQLVAVGPGPFGRTADQEELARLNPDLGLDRPLLPGRLGLAEALILDPGPSGRAGWAFDPATRVAVRRGLPGGAPLAPLYPAPAFTGPVLAREGRIGMTWFGLLPDGMAINAPIAAQDAAGGFLPPMPGAGAGRLWRGRVSGPPEPDAPPAATDVLETAEPVPGLDPLPAGGLVMGGPGRLLALADPPSILLAQVGRGGAMQEWLSRLRLDGSRVWTLELPTTEAIGWAFAEPARLWLLGMPAGSFAALHAIAPADGRILRTRHI